MKARQITRAANPEECAMTHLSAALSAAIRCPVEIPITSLDQCGRRVGPIHATEGMENGQISRGVDLEYGSASRVAAASACTPVEGCPVEVPVSSLDQPG